MLDVKRMRILKEVADRGSFSAAAEALSYTQSAVSQQIAALEREAGAQLVTRGSRGIKLTEAGETLVKHADAILTRLADAEAELEAIRGLRGGRLRLAAFQTVGATLMPLAIAIFRQRHPDIELSIRQLEDDESMPMLKGGDLDIALTVDESTAADEYAESIDTTFLLDDPMYAALPLGHRLAGVQFDPSVALAFMALDHAALLAPIEREPGLASEWDADPASHAEPPLEATLRR